MTVRQFQHDKTGEIFGGKTEVIMRHVTLTLTALLLTATRKEATNYYYKSTEPEDFVVGALFSVHQSPHTTVTPSRACGTIWEGPGVQRVEAALQTIDEINSSEELLPNSTMGMLIRDTCWYIPISLEQASYFIKLSVWLDTKYLDQPYPYTRRAADDCDSEQADRKLVAVLGPSATSGVAEVHSLLRLFEIPQVGYDFTGQEIGPRDRNGYYVGILPADQGEARAMVDLVAHFNWTYVSTIYTDGDGSSRASLEEFTDRGSRRGICVAQKIALPVTAMDGDYRAAVRSLRETPRARVVVCFCDTTTVLGLLQALKAENATQEFIFVGSDAWSTSVEYLQGVEEAAVGSIAIRLRAYQDSSFESYFLALKPSTNTRDPWFCEFWEEKFQCSVKNRNLTTCPGKHANVCTEGESLHKDYSQDPKVAGVKTALYVIAHALDSMIRDFCDQESHKDCSRKMHVTPSEFLGYLDNATLYIGNGSMGISTTEEEPIRYDIVNFQKQNGSTYDFVRIATWDSDTLSVFRDPTWKKGDAEIPKSLCGLPCSKGQVRVPESSTSLCCWECINCGESQYVGSEYLCRDCPEGTWPNHEQNGCNAIPLKYLQWTETASIIVIVFSVGIILTTCFVAAVYVRHITTPLIKASSRELSFVILLGIVWCNASSFAILAKPTRTICFLERFTPPFGVATMHAAIFTKTNRIARILAVGDDKIFSRNHRFMSTTSQLVITALLILGQALISGTMLAVQPPGIEYFYPAPDRVMLVCNTSKLASFLGLGYDFLLICLCTVYAVKTRNVPENFNEAKMIGFAMYATVVIWIAYVSVYVGSEKNQEMALCLAMCCSSSMVLALLFMPKIYVILFQPHKNKRSAFLTFTKDIRQKPVTTISDNIAVSDPPGSEKFASKSEKTS